MSSYHDENPEESVENCSSTNNKKSSGEKRFSHKITSFG